MRRPRWRALSFVAVLGLCLVSIGLRAQFRSGVDLVRVPVVVLDENDAVVDGLTQADFEVFEEGEPQTIAFFAEGAPGRSLPLRLGLLLDTSESMEEELSMATSAAVRFINALDEAADVTFVDFDDGVRLGRFSPPSFPQLFSRIRSVRAGGGTALYDALGVYLEAAVSRSGQHVVLLHTDGGDSTSSLSFDRLIDLLRQANVIVYAIGYLGVQRGPDRLWQQTRLMGLARETGGEAFFPLSSEALDRAYARIRAELEGRYTLGYVSSRPPGPGFRRLDVRVSRPDLKGVSVRARSGYTASAH